MLNVQGLISKRVNKLKSKELFPIFQNNDIILFTETWTSDISDLNVDGFECFPLHRTSKPGSKRNSGGIAIYIRNEYVSDDILFLQSDDDILWLKISGSKINLVHDLYLGLCYVIPELSSRQSIVDTSTFDRLNDSVISINSITNEQCHILLAGDFNSRTSDNADYVAFDSDSNFDVLPDDYIADKCLPRFSQDKGHLNSNGTFLLDLCKQTGLRILNGRVGSDAGIGKYTFVGHRGSSLVDYVLASNDIFTLITDFSVEEPNILSDHCLISLELQLPGTVSDKNSENTYHVGNGQVHSKLVWNNDFKDRFVEELQSESIASQFNDLISLAENCSNASDINNVVNSTVTVLENVAKPLFEKHLSAKKKTTGLNNKKHNPWYNRECEQAKYVFLNNLNIFRQNKCDMTRINLVKSRSDYKSTLRTSKFNYDKYNTLKLEEARLKDAKTYWRMLKESCGIKTSQIDITTFENYFKAINNPNDHFFSPDEDVIYFNERYLNDEFEIMFEELNADITQQEVSKAIKQLKCGRSGGPDQLLNEFFIYGERVLIPVFFYHF